MGDRDRETLAKARKELEELYLGIPDDSVNLTFQDLAEVRQHKKKLSPSQTMEAITESTSKKSETPLTKHPSLDFSKGLLASFQGSNNHHMMNYHCDNHQNHHDIFNPSHHRPDEIPMRSPRGHMYGHHDHHTVSPRHHHHESSHNTHNGVGPRHADEMNIAFDDMSHGMSVGYGRQRGDHANSPRRPRHLENLHIAYHGVGPKHGDEMSMGFDDMSQMSVAYGQERGGGRRRPGIPHSNTCTVCCNYIYLFRHRCLVCGRAYCRQCVSIGMGEMTEGRKCIQCLGRRFSQRYIQKAGNIGCCMGYPSIVKQQELKWAEKGPRRSGENRYGGHSVMVSRSRSPLTRPTTPTSQHSPSNPPSFVAGSPYSPYTTTSHHHLPF